MNFNNEIKKLARLNNNFIAYNQVFSNKKDNNVEIIFLRGFYSNMNGTKAQRLADYCRKHNYQLTIFDYYGHGQSSGEFTEGTIGLWLEDSLAILDTLTTKKQIIVGSSMGGWLALLLAKKRPERLAGLIGIASAPDFTEDIIYNNLSKVQKEKLQNREVVHFAKSYCDETYPITQGLIEDARNYLIKNTSIDILCPVYLLHGMNDKDIPYSTSIKLSSQLKTQDLHVLLKKDGEHNMNQQEDLELLEYALSSLIKKII